MSDPKYMPQDAAGKLTRLIEECSEVIKICCKIQRFGLSSYHPDDLGKTTNQMLLLNELGDLGEAIGIYKQTFNADEKAQEAKHPEPLKVKLDKLCTPDNDNTPI